MHFVNKKILPHCSSPSKGLLLDINHRVAPGARAHGILEAFCHAPGSISSLRDNNDTPQTNLAEVFEMISGAPHIIFVRDHMPKQSFHFRIDQPDDRKIAVFHAGATNSFASFNCQIRTGSSIAGDLHECLLKNIFVDCCR